MLAGVDVREVIQKFGNKGTTKEVILRMVKAFGLWPETNLWQLPSREELPRNGLVKLTRPGRKCFHWACIIDGVIHDPACDMPGVTVARHQVACFIGVKKKG